MSSNKIDLLNAVVITKSHDRHSGELGNIRFSTPSYEPGIMMYAIKFDDGTGGFYASDEFEYLDKYKLKEMKLNACKNDRSC